MMRTVGSPPTDSRSEPVIGLLQRVTQARVEAGDATIAEIVRAVHYG